MDELGTQPRCPNCGTVMVDDGPAAWCRGCGWIGFEAPVFKVPS